MGVGRFAYTPMLPVMQTEAGLSHALAGLLASSNLAGYLAGVLVAMGAAFRTRRLGVVRWGLAAVIATTALMAIPSPSLWIAARFATGVASGFVFVLSSSIVLDRAALEGKHGWVGVFYAGVGAGIVASGLLIPAALRFGDWRAGWLGLALVSAVASIGVLLWFDDWGHPEFAHEHATIAAERGAFWWLFTAYGGEGLGYIIPATFMVAMIAATPAIASLASANWIVVGLVAIPSSFVWSRIGIAIGRRTALAAALFLQAGGIVAPILVPGAVAVVLSAVTLGGTFMGATALANALGRESYPESSHIAVGRLATIFGFGQIAGPLLATSLTVRTGSYTAATEAAAVIVLISASLMALSAVRR